MKKVFLVLLSISLISCDVLTPPPIIITHIDTVCPPQLQNPIDGTAVDTTKAWPIKVVSVERNVDKSIDMKWEVVTENGVMYYTNHKPQIGDVAFCLGMDEEIVECDCKK
jgi:hypothetical protein